MKKIIYSLLALSLILSCSDTDDHGVDVNNFDGIYFVDGTSDYLIDNNGLPKLIELGSTMTSSSDRTFTIEIDESSTATAGVDYDLDSSSVTIPAGSSSATFAINGYFGAATPEGVTLKLLVSDNNMTIVYDMGIFQYCVSDIAGMYSMTTTYGFHDFLPTYETNTQDMEIVELGGGEYSIADFTGGLYSDGPYSGAYNTTATDAVITENCGLISWSGQSDPWGAMIPLAGGENTVDSNGVITISWYCEGYGENGVSVYTPL
jgi:hypothetical protein